MIAIMGLCKIGKIIIGSAEGSLIEKKITACLTVSVINM